MLAAVLGSVIGLERERLLWAPGLRTHMLVCVGSCLIIIISAYSFNDVLNSHITLDPSRIAAQVVSGIGFLGAGVILFRGDVVRGLTTAASIWTVAGIGLAVGGGLYLAAITTTIIILIILALLKPFEEKFKANRSLCVMKFQAVQGKMSINLLKETIGGRSHYIQQLIISPSDSPNLDDVVLTLIKIPRKTSFELMEEIRRLTCIKNHEVNITFGSKAAHSK